MKLNSKHQLCFASSPFHFKETQHGLYLYRDLQRLISQERHETMFATILGAKTVTHLRFEIELHRVNCFFSSFVIYDKQSKAAITHFALQPDMMSAKLCGLKQMLKICYEYGIQTVANREPMCNKFLHGPHFARFFLPFLFCFLVGI